jgi:hypothetical protein
VRKPRIEAMLTMLPGRFSATHQPGAAQVGVDDGVPVLFRHFERRLHDRDAGVVDDDVEGAGGIEGGGDRLGGLHVEIDRRRRDPVLCEFGLQGLQAICTACRQHDRCSRRTEATREMRAESRRGTGNQGRLAAEVECLHTTF